MGIDAALILAILNNAAIHIHVYALVWPMFSFLSVRHLGVELLGHTVILPLICWGTARLFSKEAVSRYMPTSHI